MSDTCGDNGCEWELPADTPAFLVAYVMALHRAYDCPQTTPDDTQTETGSEGAAS